MIRTFMNWKDKVTKRKPPPRRPGRRRADPGPPGPPRPPGGGRRPKRKRKPKRKPKRKRPRKHAPKKVGRKTATATNKGKKRKMSFDYDAEETDAYGITPPHSPAPSVAGPSSSSSWAPTGGLSGSSTITTTGSAPKFTKTHRARLAELAKKSHLQSLSPATLDVNLPSPLHFTSLTSGNNLNPQTIQLPPITSFLDRAAPLAPSFQSPIYDYSPGATGTSADTYLQYL